MPEFGFERAINAFIRMDLGTAGRFNAVSARLRPVLMNREIVQGREKFFFLILDHAFEKIDERALTQRPILPS